MRAWIALIHDTVARERALVTVFAHEISFTSQLDAVRDLTPRLLAYSNGLRARQPGLVRDDLSPVGLRLLVNLVSSTILELVIDPPRDVSRTAVLDELARRVEDWIRPLGGCGRAPKLRDETATQHVSHRVLPRHAPTENG